MPLKLSLLTSFFLLFFAFSTVSAHENIYFNQGQIPTQNNTSLIASENDSDENPFSDTATIKYYSVVYLPDTNNDGLLDANLGSLSGEPIAGINSIGLDINRYEEKAAQYLSDGSRFHGYANPQVTPAIKMQKVGQTVFFDAVPKGFPTYYGQGYHPNYKTVLNNLDICRLVDEQGVRQIWFWTYQNDQIVPVESNSSFGTNIRQFWNYSNFGDISNSVRSNDMPVCQNTYFLYNYNYERGVGEMLEDHAHHIEAILRWVDEDLFWNKFVGATNGTGTLLAQNGVYQCGWSHYAPNSKKDYEWRNLANVTSNCQDWRPDGRGQSAPINCNTWPEYACDEDAGATFKKWWFQNLPGFSNRIMDANGQYMRNWWEFYMDFDKAISRSQSLTSTTPALNPGQVNDNIKQVSLNGISLSRNISSDILAVDLSSKGTFMMPLKVTSSNGLSREMPIKIVYKNANAPLPSPTPTNPEPATPIDGYFPSPEPKRADGIVFPDPASLPQIEASCDNKNNSLVIRPKFQEADFPNSSTIRYGLYSSYPQTSDASYNTQNATPSYIDGAGYKWTNYALNALSISSSKNRSPVGMYFVEWGHPDPSCPGNFCVSNYVDIYCPTS